MNISTVTATITILVDNWANEGWVAEHGFSAWIETAGQKILFDTGQGPALSSNACKLSVPIESTDCLILSHGHYDHTGGVPWVIENAPAVQVYCHPAAASPRYAVRDGTARTIALPQPSQLALARLHQERLHWTTRATEIAPGVGLTGPIPRLTDYEDVGGPFFLDEKGRHADSLHDDMALWMRTKLGLAVVLGCGHAGVINTLNHALRLSGASRIHAVLGGFHLREASDMRIERTLEALRAFAPDLIVPCHCTGEHAVERLAQTFGDQVCVGSAGNTYVLGNAGASK